MDLGAYQVALEEVLTWLLEAEDQLAQHEHIPENLELLKERFHAHEVTDDWKSNFRSVFTVF